ncbi:hypothetical protein JCM10908_000927 [Rhodotorula pacifica]|uniref:homeobox domain-containing protein n=1 Tax=Rhodotorula pacifica TaxID=1495444 RepID=UPI003178D9AB
MQHASRKPAVSYFEQIAYLADRCLRALPPIPDASGEGFLAPDLVLPSAPSILAQLVTLGCSETAAASLSELVAAAVGDIERAIRSSWKTCISAIGQAADQPADQKAWADTLHKVHYDQFRAQVALIEQKVVDEVRAAQLRHSTASPAPPPPTATTAPSEPITLLSGHFNPSITSLLQSAYEAHQSDLPPNKGERRELARATGLTEKQVVTWFSNARQREKKRREKEGGTAAATASMRRSSARSQPYDIEMAPQHRRRLSAEQQQRYPSEMRPQQHNGRGRKWSGSSALSALSSSVGSSASSVDLVEYVETAGPTFVLPDPAPAPVPAPTPASAKVQVDVSASLDPSGWFSLASPHSSLSLSPPPPAPITTPTNIALHEEDAACERFLGVPAGSPEAGQLAPSPSAWSSSAAVSPTPSIESPSAVLMSDELPFPPTVPAASDAWMDDEFFRNLFSSVGFEMEVGIGVDGLFSDGRSAADKRGGASGGGGLTLRMEDLRRDEQVMMQL